MDWQQLLVGLFFDYTLRTVALGASVLGIVSGALGAFAILRKQSLLGDAMSHAALPGIVLAFLLTRSREPLVLLIGALVAGLLGTLLLLHVINNSRLKIDSALGLVLSVFFGFGLVLLTFTQRLPDAKQAGLDRYLFGQAATLLARDVVNMAVFGVAALAVLILLWKEFKLLSFDSAYAASLGYSVRWLDVTLMVLTVVAIVIGLQTVGVVLMSAMLVAPAAAARQWTDRLGRMVFLSACFGAVAGVAGTLLSSSSTNLATGPLIVLCSSAIVLFSLLFAPNRGLVFNWLRQWRNRHRLQARSVLEDLTRLAAQHPDHERGHSVTVLKAISTNPDAVPYVLHQLAKLGLARESAPDEWLLTPAGKQRVLDNNQPGSAQP